MGDARGGGAAGSTKRFRHPVVGLLELDCESMLVSAENQVLLVHSARPGTEAYERLQLLRVVGLQDLSPGGPGMSRPSSGG